jgi:16S rRNA (cytosine1402-N4)-methyltransferase
MHVSVLLDEVLELLAVRPGGVYIDGTVGFAGHARAIMERAGPDGRLLGIDRDPQALEAAARHLADAPGESVLIHGCHGAIRRIAAENGFAEADGILLDLGVSSWQLDNAQRGFSFMRDGRLSMRMDPGAEGADAAALLADLSDDELAEIFRRYGEEPRARRIAGAIVKAREKRAIVSTLQLAGVVSDAVGWSAPKHLARVFQALRMAVNAEMEELEQALADGLKLLRPGGRMAVIAFESLTDGMVKRFFAEHAGRWLSLQQGGERWTGGEPPVKRVTRKPVEAGAAEVKRNPRARSARLRVVERLEQVPVARRKRY